ncbi:hypothetical protein NDU88_006012 [Pleurodeles waltl]|uniref:Uncharacterized protein n=1 Tax=Pleurodeles waltl TaxID=8319 RepID=A0AAV7TDW1_PLEWA|nr:hypothetical protein NDU88_006012 [Pleurodeles waltl]
MHGRQRSARVATAGGPRRTWEFAAYGRPQIGTESARGAEAPDESKTHWNGPGERDRGCLGSSVPRFLPCLPPSRQRSRSPELRRAAGRRSARIATADRRGVIHYRNDHRQRYWAWGAPIVTETGAEGRAQAP